MEDEVGGACGTHGKGEEMYKVFWREIPKKRDHS
jgi:hypothetical protein